MSLKSKYFEVVFEDEQLLILNKSAGISVIPERNHQQQSILEWLKNRFEYIKPAHRIDKETSGLVIFVKDEETYKAMNKLFQERKITKEYIAITTGRPYKDEIVIDLPIKQSNNSVHMKVCQTGKPSVSNIKVIENTNHYGLLNIQIITGRTHQIRVHLSHKGFPIIGDALYNRQPNVFLSRIKRNYTTSKNATERPMMTRTALHACMVEFVHPLSNETIKFESELPKDMRVCWKQLVKFDKN